jgi:hypothetical protein
MDSSSLLPPNLLENPQAIAAAALFLNIFPKRLREKMEALNITLAPLPNQSLDLSHLITLGMS